MGRPLLYPQDNLAERLAPLPSGFGNATLNEILRRVGGTDSISATPTSLSSSFVTNNTGPTAAELEIIERYRLIPAPDLPETSEYDFLRTPTLNSSSSSTVDQQFVRLNYLRSMLEVREVLTTMRSEGRTLRAGSGNPITNLDSTLYDIRTSDGPDPRGDSFDIMLNDFVNRDDASASAGEPDAQPRAEPAPAIGVFVAPDVYLSPSRTARTSTRSTQEATSVEPPLTYPIETVPLSNSRAEAYRRLRTPDVPLHLPLLSSIDHSAGVESGSSASDVSERLTSFRVRLEAIRVTSSERSDETESVLRSARTALRTAVGFAERLEQVTRILTRIADSVVSDRESSLLSGSESEPSLPNIRFLPLDPSISLQNSLNQLRAASTRIDRVLEERSRSYAAAASSSSTTLGLRVLDATRYSSDRDDPTSASPEIGFPETRSTNPYTPFIPSDLNLSPIASFPIPISYSRIHLSSTYSNSTSDETSNPGDLVDFSRLRLIPGISYSMRLPIHQSTTSPEPATASLPVNEGVSAGRERSRNVASQAGVVPTPRLEGESTTAATIRAGTGRSWLRIDRNGDAVVGGNNESMMEGRKTVTKERVGR